MPRPRIYHEERVATALRLPQSLYHALKVAAQQRDVSANSLAVRALSDYLERLTDPAEPR